MDRCSSSPGPKEPDGFPEPRSWAWTLDAWLPFTQTVGGGTAMVISPASSPNSHLREDDLGEMFAVCSVTREGRNEED